MDVEENGGGGLEKNGCTSIKHVQNQATLAAPDVSRDFDENGGGVICAIVLSWGGFEIPFPCPKPSTFRKGCSRGWSGDKPTPREKTAPHPFPMLKATPPSHGSRVDGCEQVFSGDKPALRGRNGSTSMKHAQTNAALAR